MTIDPIDLINRMGLIIKFPTTPLSQKYRKKLVKFINKIFKVAHFHNDAGSNLIGGSLITAA